MIELYNKHLPMFNTTLAIDLEGVSDEMPFLNC